MNLKGRYELIVDYELPDGSFTPIKNIINFFLQDNYKAIKNIKDDLNNDYLFFDDSSYGVLDFNNTASYVLRNTFIELGLVSKSFKIIKSKELLDLLMSMKEDASELCNNKEKYIREAKLNMIILN